MAYYNDQDEEQQATDPNAPAVVAPGGESGTISGQGSAGSNSGAAAAAETPAATGAPGGPNQFVGIKEYLNANKPQTAKLTSDVSSYVNDLGNQARSQLETGQKGFNQAVERNTVALNQDLLNQAVNDPTAIAKDQAKLQDFKTQRDASYKGPNSFDQSDFFQPVNQAVQKATQASANTATESGQRDLLAQVQNAKKGRVNQGALAFDASLLQSDPNSKTMLAKTRDSLKDIPEKLTAAQQSALEKATQAGKTTDATKAAIQGAFSGPNGAQSTLEKNIQNRANSAVNQSKEQAAQTFEFLKSGATPNDAQLELLDISRDQWNQLTGDRSYLQNTYGVNPYQDLSVYGELKNPETQINAQNIATADDYARYAALNQLMDTQNTFLSDPSLAGTADLDSLGFRFDDAQSNIQNSIQLEKKAAEQRAAEAAAAAARNQGGGGLLGTAAGVALGGPIGGAIGSVFCFLENTPILMEDGDFVMVQDLDLGDRVAHGGIVMAHGASLCLDLVEYKGRFTSKNHAVFDGDKFVRACHLKDGVAHSLDNPVIVYPVVTEEHFLVSDNGVVYADMMEVDEPGISDADKLLLLNDESNLEVAQSIEKEISWTLLSSEPHTMLN
ncbi:MAG: hypothetical protein HC838_00195 [Spirulinaceae cyanobacterium RM2_2_10]|nr:hypothetical protein [Spirulinaceae cyanobacterium RM2_2_10]